jgi:protocatechuate 3,4-dioxygenase beta subunit
MRSFPILIIGLATLLIQPLVSHAAGTETSKPARQTITGKVTDALGRPLAGAALELQNSAGKIVAKAESDTEGHFTFAGVAPAVYAVVASKASFKTATAIVNLTGQAS